MALSGYQTGLWAERFAALYLCLKGYWIIARRFKTPSGEIDLIARRGRFLCFVEVKFRPTIEAAAHALLPRQRRRIVKAAQFFLCQNPQVGYGDLRFDVVLLAPFAWPHHLTNCFDESAL